MRPVLNEVTIIKHVKILHYGRYFYSTIGGFFNCPFLTDLCNSMAVFNVDEI